ncbi:hypothetical protein JOQ06_028187, partial [Pogonophryne albipinna]
MSEWADGLFQSHLLSDVSQRSERHFIPRVSMVTRLQLREVFMSSHFLVSPFALKQTQMSS